MAFGSGSSLGIERWTRRSGFPSSLQLLRVGKATLLHQHSSKKPTPPTRDGARRGQSVGRGVFFSLIQRVGGGDPALRPLPPHSEKARERRPDRLAGDPPLRYSFLEGNLGGHRERPEARLPAKLSRRTMQQPPQSLGAFLLEGIAGSEGTRRFGCQSTHAPCVEVVDGVAHRLLPTAQVLGDLWDFVALRRS